VLAEPIDDKAIRREQAQRGVIIDGLQWSDPGVELLLGKLYLQDAEALVPKRRLDRQNTPRWAADGGVATMKKANDRAVYTLCTGAARCSYPQLAKG